jgi:hypothetical protein
MQQQAAQQQQYQQQAAYQQPAAAQQQQYQQPAAQQQYQQQPAPAAWQPNLPAPPQLAAPAAPQVVAQQPVATYQPVAAPMPLYQPFAGQPMPVQQAPVAYAQAPVAYQQAPAVAYQQPPQPQMVAATTQIPVAAPEASVAEGARRTSRAPKGMGSSLRLDDPSLRDTIDRARSERAGLAEEYRKLTAPLVEVDAPMYQEQQQPQYAAQQPVLVGHDPNGVPLFATPGIPGVQPIAHYPGPARVPSGQAPMPRPSVQAPHGVVDPALSSTSAFQRRTPYAPEVAAPQAPPAQPGSYAHA